MMSRKEIGSLKDAIGGNMEVSIIGTGYVGLVTGACLAKLGNRVLCCDIDENKINLLKSGGVPFYEPGLKDLISNNVNERRLSFTTSLKEAIDFGTFIFIAVGTPDKNGDVDLSFVYSVAESIGKYLNSSGKIIVNKSTVPVGTGGKVSRLIGQKLKSRKKSFSFGLASNPEFLREGSAISDFMKPDRIVVGSESEWVAIKMRELYLPITKDGYRIFTSDLVSAEISKYASNVCLAARISLANEISVLCEKAGADVEKVRDMMTADKRIGPHFLNAGVGYGGSCFPKDVLGFIKMAKKFGHRASIAEAVNETNKKSRRRFIEKIGRDLSPLGGKTISVWGLSFKPNTDDMREAPSIDIINFLLSGGAKVKVYDPVAINEAKKIFGDKIFYTTDMYKCLDGSDALVIATEWPEFKEAYLKRVRNLLKTPIIFDGRNIYPLEQMRREKFHYISIGRVRVTP